MRRCLRQHRGELSESCKAFGAEQQQRFRDGAGGPLMEACRSDIETVCSDVEPGQGRVKACLQEKSDRVSNGCTTFLTR